MSQVLSGLNLCFTYLDDIFIYSTACEEHLQHLQIVFNHLKLSKLKIKHSQCQFFKWHLHFLGYLISEQGIQPIPEKLIAVTNSKELSSLDELHYFLGLTGYYRRFNPLFANITKPLNRLLKKDTKFKLSAGCQPAFEHPKKLFMWNLSYSTLTWKNCTPCSLMLIIMPSLASSLRQLVVLMIWGP